MTASHAQSKDAQAAEGCTSGSGEQGLQTAAQLAQAQDEKQRLSQRQKQIDFGKNTIGYQRYVQQVPKHKRKARDPVTPDIHADVSKRNFEGQVKAWRRSLHLWDQGDASSARQASKRIAGVGVKQQSEEDEGQPGSSGESEGPEPPSSNGSLDGYMPKSSQQGSRKRPLESQYAPDQSHAVQRRDECQESLHDAKRTTSNKIKDSSVGPAGAPTCFPTSHKVSVSQTDVTGATNLQHEQHNGSKDDNVLAMILGSENGSRSAMSWADEEPGL